VIFRHRISNEQPTALLDEVCDECIPVEGPDVAFLRWGPDMVECHRETVFPLVRAVRPQMPEEFAVGSTAFESAKSDRVDAVVHLGPW